MRLSKHAESRCRSRSIQELTVMLLGRLGRAFKSRDNTEIWIANAQDCRDILKLLKAVQRNFERTDPPYAVVAKDGTVVTTGYRTQKIHRR